jgi:hypothetical protein
MHYILYNPLIRILMKYNKRIQFKTTEEDFHKMQKEADSLRMTLSNYCRLKMINDEVSV